MKNFPNYPPDNLSPSHFHSITSQIRDYQANHGSLLKVIGQDTLHSVGTSIFPTPFPRRLFNRAIRDLQPVYDELYCKLADDEEWLYAVTGPLRKTDPLVEALWSVYEEVKRRRRDAAAEYVEQKVHAGIFRSDYMLHVDDDGDDDDDDWIRNTSLKQVEFNSYSCAGGCHADKVGKMHQYLVRRGVYDFSSLAPRNSSSNSETSISPSSLPTNNTIHGIASLLASAHKTYGSAPYNPAASKTAVLIIVQPNNFNIADERPIEYALWNWKEGDGDGDDDDDDSPIPTYRIEWQDILLYTTLTPSGELLLYPPEHGKHQHPLEVSVIYHRAGYEPHEYISSSSSSSEHYTAGKETRITLELSRAIKCPPLLGHMTTIKKVQQSLTNPGVLERWLPPAKAELLRDTFVAIYPLDNTSAEGVAGRRKLAEMTTTTNHRMQDRYILKPASREGGGHNIYGADIPKFIRERNVFSASSSSSLSSQLDGYILMERIRAPNNVYNVLMASARGIVADEVVSELGIFGGCLWEKNSAHAQGEGEGEGKERSHMIENKVVGWSFKTKEVGVDEMSVVKGYGCFDTPLLIDE